MARKGGDGIATHKLGTSLRDLGTSGGLVLTGLTMKCGICKEECIIRADRVEYAWCPYCGAEGVPESTGKITDTRPCHSDD